MLSTAAHQFLANYEKWKTNLIASKSQALLVTRIRNRELPDSEFSFNTNIIEWESTAKYLGVIIDKKLTMKQHIEYVIGKTQNAIKILYPLINRRSKLKTQHQQQTASVQASPSAYLYLCLSSIC